MNFQAAPAPQDPTSTPPSPPTSPGLHGAEATDPRADPSDGRRALVEQKILTYLASVTKIDRPLAFYLERTLNDFPVESLELFELMMEIEDAIGIEVSDDVLDASLTIGTMIKMICKGP